MLYVVRRVSCEPLEDDGDYLHPLRSHLVALGLPMMLSLAQQVLGDVLPPRAATSRRRREPAKIPARHLRAGRERRRRPRQLLHRTNPPGARPSAQTTRRRRPTVRASSCPSASSAPGVRHREGIILQPDRCLQQRQDVPPSDIPATGESACGAGKTCSQVGELEENECRRMGFSGPETYGNSWKRRCTERTSAALVASPSTPLTCTSNNGGAALMQPGGNAGFECVEEGSQDDDSGGPRLAASVVGGLAAASFAAIAARLR